MGSKVIELHPRIIVSDIAKSNFVELINRMLKEYITDEILSVAFQQFIYNVQDKHGDGEARKIVSMFEADIPPVLPWNIRDLVTGMIGGYEAKE